LYHNKEIKKEIKNVISGVSKGTERKMLQSLHVKNLALIDEAEVEFEEGLNILSGETGAGKSIVLGSVNLALGSRYSKEIIREGADYGLVELVFRIRDEKQLKKLEELDIYPEGQEIILSRRLMEGRSISRINGETVTAGLLKKVSEILIDIHGQHEHQSLLYEKNHLAILDAFSKDASANIKEQVKETYKEYKELKQKLKEAALDEAQRKKEIDFLGFEISQIMEAQLEKGEDEVLEEAYKRMANSKKITGNLEETHQYLSGMPESASELFGRSIRCMAELVSYDTKAEALYEQLMEVDTLLNDFNRELADYQKESEFSEEEFYKTETRLNEINRLKTKYGNTVEEILAYCDEKKQRLEVLEHYEVYLSELQQSTEAKKQELTKLCDRLSKIRREYAKKLSGEIIKGLNDLNFLDVQFEIAFEQLKEATANGSDAAEFLISMNPGEPLRALKDIASGGELSRIMLAIKSVLADKDEIETLIFDEIDVGISGRTAQKVSEKMSVIGGKHQVICITHLAQIAAMADSHYVIEKNTKNGITRTNIRKLKEEETAEELARILGGAKITQLVMQNAKEMKALAKTYKKSQSVQKDTE